MSTRLKRSCAARLATAGTLTGLLLAAVAGPALAGPGASSSGELRQLAAAATETPDLSGRVHVVRTGSGRTLLTVQVRGLAPGETYGVHLHNAPCSAVNPGGGHDKHDPDGPPQPPNELWASSDPHDEMAGITANAAGNARGRGTAGWTAGAAAQAVVIHIGFGHGGTAAGGAKLACADLR